MGKGGTILGLIGILLGASGVIFGYFNWTNQNTTNNLTGTIVVGIWTGLDENIDYAPYNSQMNWLLELQNNKLNNTEYISVSNTNTRITLLKPGWYHIHLISELTSIASNRIYYIRILKDGINEFVLDRLITSSSASTTHSFDSSSFVYSDGTIYIEINGNCPTDTFNVIPDSTFNQFTIEYVSV